MIQKLRIIILVVALSALCGIQNATAQGTGSGNLVFSPYTMYGFGDLLPQGSASTMSMGGIGVALRSSYEINYLNPASLSAIPQNSALFSFGARGTNNYSKTTFTKTAYNSLDLSDVGFAVPLYRGIGLSFSLQPLSAVGYNSTAIDDNSDIVGNIGRVKYDYWGEGGINQVAMGLGVVVVKGFSLGANLIYYFGNIDRYYNATIIPMLGQETIYRNVKSSDRSHVSHIGYSLGAQYSVRVGRANALTLGVTYQPNTNLKAERTDEQMLVYEGMVDTVSYSKSKYAMSIPAKLAFGLSYSSKKLTIGVDYSQQNWKGSFELPSDQGITLRTQQDYRIGLSFVPDRVSVTSALKRWTYKLGAHYTTSYLMKDNTKLNDMGVSLGADIPLTRKSPSKISIGFEYGQRGTLKIGQVKEQYFKVYAGLTLFGEDYWFFKQKFN